MGAANSSLFYQLLLCILQLGTGVAVGCWLMHRVATIRRRSHAAALDVGATESVPSPGVAAAESLTAKTSELADTLPTTATSEQAPEEPPQPGATIDAATRLPTGPSFDQELERRLAAWQAHNRSGSVLLAEIDQVTSSDDLAAEVSLDEEQFNDILRQITNVLQVVSQDHDAVLGRASENEFGLILSDTPLDVAERIAEAARAAIEEASYKAGGKDCRVTVSVGLAQATPTDHREMLRGRASSALLAAQNAGRNRVFSHNGRQCSALQPGEKEGTAAGGQQETGKESAVAVLEATSQRPSPSEKRVEAEAAARRERRKSPRHAFRATQFIAPMLHPGVMPSPELFSEIQCIDISSSGFSFVSEAPPPVDLMVVQLGGGPRAIYVSARVVVCTVTVSDGLPTFRIGCRFEGRMER
jgi:diguanylate cyclase (GGDEF)-like protein